MVCLLALALAAIAQPGNGSSEAGFELLDRGDSGLSYRGAAKTHMSPMATLAHPGAGPGVTMVSLAFLPTMAPASFIGNFYTAPGDFPTSF